MNSAFDRYTQPTINIAANQSRCSEGFFETEHSTVNFKAQLPPENDDKMTGESNC